MHQFDMTDDEVRETKWASREVAKHLDGVKLIDGLRIGSVLLKGRQHAMRAAGVNKPQGRTYAEAFREWKTAFRFREGKDAENYYDAAIVCAQHRTIADEIIGSLSGKQRTEMGVFGLAARVRAKVRELEGVPKPVRATPASRFDELASRLAEVEERMTAAEPRHVSELVALLVKWAPEEVAEMLRQTDPAWFERLIEAAREDSSL
jgi:hypothetical protein